MSHKIGHIQELKAFLPRPETLAACETKRLVMRHTMIHTGAVLITYDVIPKEGKKDGKIVSFSGNELRAAMRYYNELA